MAAALRNSETQYGILGRTLHWVSVALLLTVIVVSGQFEDLPDGLEKSSLIAQHVSFGIMLFLVMATRFTWRQMNKNPVYSYSMPAWQKRSAITLHYTIYIFVITQCLVGFVMMVFNGEKIAFFDALVVGPIMKTDDAISAFLIGAHAQLSVLVYPLFAIHISAAIYHQIFGVLDD